MLKALRSNEIVCLLCDRDIDRTGVEVEFFGERTTLPAGPATLSIRTGAPLLPAGCYFTAALQRPPRRRPPAGPDGPHGGGLRDDVARVTQALARRARVPHPPRPRAVAPVPTQLAQRPRVQRLAPWSS